MATIHINDETLTLALTSPEKLAALHGNVEVPIAAIASVRLLASGLEAVRGIRAPGLSIPATRKTGTWRGRGTRTFVAARRGMPALHLRLTGQRITDLFVSVPDAEDQLAMIQSKLHDKR